jgi:hypothetical protein
MAPPASPKVYHIFHVDKLASIVESGGLLCDAEIARRTPVGTTIGMSDIKKRRLEELTLASHPGLHVGDCVPFYFCPRSVMLYLIRQGNHPNLGYVGGQSPIVHLEADLRSVVAWANDAGLRWAFTLSNAGSYFFEDRSSLEALNEIDWAAVQARDWRNCKEGKQAEFLLEGRFPLQLIERIGVLNAATHLEVAHALPAVGPRPQVEIRPDWYY